MGGTLGACSPTLCLGHFKVKFSSTNVQPVSKEKFLWRCRVGLAASVVLSTQGCRPSASTLIISTPPYTPRLPLAHCPRSRHPGPPHSRTNSTLTCPLPHALLFMATPAPASCTSVRRGPCSASTHDCWAADSWRVESPSATEPQPALGRSHSVAYWVLSWVPFLMFRVTRSRVWMNP